MKNTNQKRGFTLIELLVVIVILGILSTISVGTFRSYFSKARDSERVSAVQNVAMMIKVDSGGEGTPMVYRYGETDGSCITEETTGGEGDTAVTDCMALDELFAENDFNMPDSKNGMLYKYCFQAGAVAGNNDFFIAVQAEETGTPNGQDGNTDQTSGQDISLFVDGTMAGVEAALDATFIEWDGGEADVASGDWVCGTIDGDGVLTIDS